MVGLGWVGLSWKRGLEFLDSHRTRERKGEERKRERERETQSAPNLSRHKLSSPQNQNDPNAGSPTITLLRLLLSLNHRVWVGSAIHLRHTHTRKARARAAEGKPLPASLKDSIDSSDGRCVQRAEPYSMRDDDARLQGIPRSRLKVARIYPHHDARFADYPGLPAEESGAAARAEPAYQNSLDASV